MPAAASDRMTSRMPATSSGSSADVASSNSISLGVERQCASDRDALLLAARQPRRIHVDLVGESDRGELGTSPGPGIRSAQPPGLAQPEHEVLLSRQVWEHVEVLEDHADLGPQAGEAPPFLAPQPGDPSVLDRRAVLVAVERHGARCRRGDEVHAAQQGALAGSAGADDAHHLAPVDLEVDPVQHLDRPERLGDRLGAATTARPCVFRPLHP